MICWGRGGEDGNAGEACVILAKVFGNKPSFSE